MYSMCLFKPNCFKGSEGTLGKCHTCWQMPWQSLNDQNAFFDLSWCKLLRKLLRRTLLIGIKKLPNLRCDNDVTGRKEGAGRCVGPWYSTIIAQHIVQPPPFVQSHQCHRCHTSNLVIFSIPISNVRLSSLRKSLRHERSKKAFWSFRLRHGICQRVWH